MQFKGNYMKNTYAKCMPGSNVGGRGGGRTAELIIAEFSNLVSNQTRLARPADAANDACVRPMEGPKTMSILFSSVADPHPDPLHLAGSGST